MDQNSQMQSDLVHFARLALTGRAQDVRAYISLLGRRYRTSAPELATRLHELAAEHITPRAPVRNAEVATVPVDADTRLDLVRFEAAPVLAQKPVWAPAVGQALGAIVAEHRQARNLSAVGLWPTRTCVFTGPPGVGKTLAARWLAAELGRPLLVLDLSAVMSSFLGRTGANLRHVLDYAKGIPCVLLLDEIDTIAKRRDDAQEVGELKRLVNVLLQEIDDWPAGGLLVTATNHPALLDPAVWRRFEISVDFPLPEFAATRQLVEQLLSDVPASQAIAAAVAFALSGQSFSDTEREVLAARKASVVAGTSLTDELIRLIRASCAGLKRADRKQLALALVGSGMSARDANTITGVSRDTIRKARAGSGGNGHG